MRVIKSLGDGKFEIQMEPKDKSTFRQCGFGVEHDYAWFDGTIHAKNLDGSTNFEVYIQDDVHIPIKAFIEVALPIILASKYAQPAHLEDRIHEKDDEYWNSKYAEKEGLKGPRYRKGDKYPAYSYQDVAISYWDGETKQKMVAVCLTGEKVFNHMTKQFFDKYVKNNLNESD